MTNAITSRDNQWIKLACSLKNKKGRQENSRVLVEGSRLISDAAKNGIQDVICFVREDMLQREEIEVLQQQGSQLGWQFFSVTGPVYDKLKSTQTPQGIAAILPYFEYTQDTLGTLPPGPVVYLQKIQDPGNLGTIIRTAAAASAAAVFLSEDSVDLYNDKTLRSAMGAVFKIPVVQHMSEGMLLQFCRDAHRTLMGTTPHGNCSYVAADYGQPVVLAFGNEGNGLEQEFLAHCDETITIPMRSDTESLNLSMSVGLVLYKAWESNGFREEI